MTRFSIERLRVPADAGSGRERAIREWGKRDRRHRNWPVVYILNDERSIYVGESSNAEARLVQHGLSSERGRLDEIRVVLDDRFNKSACHDLESQLIAYLAAENRLAVLNGNGGITDADYFERAAYRRTFDEIFEHLREHEHLFTLTADELANSELFKFSPFKALNEDQLAAVCDILEGLLQDLGEDAGAALTADSELDVLIPLSRAARATGHRASPIVVDGNPGTGKTVLAVFLAKMLADIGSRDPHEPIDDNSLFAEFFLAENAELLRSARIGFVIPQTSLRDTVRRVFKATPGLSAAQVLSPHDVGKSSERFDVLIVDEAHRLSQRANQASARQNSDFISINERLFEQDAPQYTQLDWILHQTRFAILLVDAKQTVRPSDLPATQTRTLIETAHRDGRHYRLATQMRLRDAQDFVDYVRSVLDDERPKPVDFGSYDVRFFDDAGELKRAIRDQDAKLGLSRLVAGFAWEWKSKKDRSLHDFTLDGEPMRWNTRVTGWVNSPTAIEEVGSIHTLQGYDLNYTGVIIGPDLRFDEQQGRIVYSPADYKDARGRQNNRQLGITYSDDDILTYIKNIYAVLLTRGIRGTYIYACDPALREYLRPYFGA